MNETITTPTPEHFDLIPFDYQSNPVRVYRDPGGEPWYCAQDVCRILGLQSTTRALIELDRDEKRTISVAHDGNNNSNLRIINEAGVYHLIFKSRKPEAKEFKRWLATEVIPSIRRTGRFSVSGDAGREEAARMFVYGWHVRGVMATFGLSEDDICKIRECRRIGLHDKEIATLLGHSSCDLRKIESELALAGLTPVKTSISARARWRETLYRDMGLTDPEQLRIARRNAPPQTARVKGLTRGQRDAAISMLSSGFSHIEIAEVVGCSSRTIDRIARKEAAS